MLNRGRRQNLSWYIANEGRKGKKGRGAGFTFLGPGKGGEKERERGPLITYGEGNIY